ncbi:hypothetical protein [Pseudomonas sp. S9]|uniref:hypothetical protein n=1 Tax=Pseudomonas sp. S9 TaxID=686578 RepID=UPI00030753E9|nr:hypothetical protein [Pseudomonas sp. S9]
MRFTISVTVVEQTVCAILKDARNLHSQANGVMVMIDPSAVRLLATRECSTCI